MARCLWPGTLAALAMLLTPRASEGNHAVALFRGEVHGPLYPQRSTDVRVEREDLSFELPDDLSSARVTATYHMTANTAASADAAFAFVRVMGGPPTLEQVRATLEVDGAPSPFETATDGQLLEPRLRAWIESRPDLERALRSAARDARRAEEPDRVLRDGFAQCARGCRALLEWYQMSGAHDPGVHLRREVALEAAREVIPDAVEELQRGWSTLPERRSLGFLIFHLGFAAGQTRTVTVRYEHQPSVDRRARVPGVYTFEYLLSPAKRWAAFGPLDITIRAPGDVVFTSPFPFRREGSTFHVKFASLPDQELTFSLMPTRGLWLGLSDHRAYWVILVATVGMVAGLTGAAAGRMARAVSRQRRLLASLLLAAPFATLAAYGVFAPLRASLPKDALGFDNGYDDRPAPGFLVPLGGLAGAVAGAVAARRRARAAPS